jgi:hypothetical protein
VTDSLDRLLAGYRIVRRRLRVVMGVNGSLAVSLGSTVATLSWQLRRLLLPLLLNERYAQLVLSLYVADLYVADLNRSHFVD